MVKCLEMLNLLLDANLYHREKKQGNISRLFGDLTESMVRLKDLMNKIKVTIKNDKSEERVGSFFKYDFAFPTFNSGFQPILPKFVKSGENAENISKLKEEIMFFVNTCTTKIMKKRC